MRPAYRIDAGAIYTVFLVAPSLSRQMELFRTIAINLAVLGSLLGAMEAASWTAIRVYNSFSQGKADVQGVVLGVKPNAESGADSLTTAYSRQSIREDLTSYNGMPGSPFGYRSYVVYGNRAANFNSVSVDDSGIRSNGSKQPLKSPVTIWMFGSSALFGVSTADDETIPSQLEKAFERKFPNRPIKVTNFGVVGYTSWQDLSHFLVRLKDYPPPDIVIFFNGINDHHNGWYGRDKECSSLLDTALGSSKLLHEAWESNASGDFVIWPRIFRAVENTFPNTLKMVGLIEKFFLYRSANANIEAWKNKYRAERDAQNRIARVCVERSEQAYIRNMRAAIRVAHDHNIHPVVIQQPLLFLTRKPLVGSEIIESEHPNYNFFGVPENDLDLLKEVPTYRVKQTKLWDKRAYTESYQRQKNHLKQIATETGAHWIDVAPTIDAAGPIATFTSPVHFTFRGTALIGQAIAEDLAAKANSIINRNAF